MKPGTAKAKGRETENAAVSWLRANGYPYAERRRLTGAEDQGDITGMPGMVVEVKSAAQWQPVKWLREAEVERENAHATLTCVLARPKGRPDVDDWVVFMTPAQWILLLEQAGWIAEEPTDLVGKPGDGYHGPAAIEEPT